MTSPPGTQQIGERLTIALRDSQGNTQELLGILQDEQTIRTRDGSLKKFDPDSITHWRVVAPISAKAGFGAPLSMRIRELEAAAATTWPAETNTEYGKWLLRASPSNSYQQNSVLPTGARPFGEPETEIETALLAVEQFYRTHGLTPAINIPLPAYTQLDEYLEALGWSIATDFNFMVIDTSDLQPLTQQQKLSVTKSDEPTPEWLAIRDKELTANFHKYPAQYISIFSDDQAVATGRIAFNGNWGVITHVLVKSDFRNQGIGKTTMFALADVARDQNCSKLTLQVDSNNSPASSLFKSLGFRLHHRDRCRISPPHIQ